MRRWTSTTRRTGCPSMPKIVGRSGEIDHGQLSKTELAALATMSGQAQRWRYHSQVVRKTAIQLPAAASSPAPRGWRWNRGTGGRFRRAACPDRVCRARRTAGGGRQRLHHAPAPTAAARGRRSSTAAELAAVERGGDRQVGVDRILDVEVVALGRAVGADHRRLALSERARRVGHDPRPVEVAAVRTRWPAA